MMKRQAKVTVSVRFWSSTLRQLQLLSQVQGREGKVDGLVQTAVDEYLESSPTDAVSVLKSDERPLIPGLQQQEEQIVHIQLWQTSLRQLQRLAKRLELEGKIGSLIRSAIDGYIGRIRGKEGVIDKLRAVRRRHERQRQFDDRVFDWLERSDEPVPAGSESPTSATEGSRGKVARFPGKRPRRNS